MTRYRACFVLFVLILGIVLAVPSPASANDYSYARVVRLSVVAGSVSIAHTGDQVWQPALANMPIQEGDTLASGAGRAEVEFENGAVVFLAENSILQFTQLALSDGGRLTQITLTQGTASFYGDLSSADSFMVLTSSLSVSLTGHAEFRVDSAANGDIVRVFQGTVEANSSAGVTQVHKGQSLSLSAEDTQDLSVAQNPKADDFDRWVGQEDQAIAVGASDSLSYMNSPFAYGAADLYAYGSWMDCSNLGPCWQPYGLTAGWAPYMDGFWSPYAGMGMTWISYEPWGWMPYHFGSWTDSAYGWVWIPGGMDMWQPAMVSWMTVGNQVGWVPLSPFDRPGVPPNNLRHGVLTNPAAAGSPIVVTRMNGASFASGQTQVTQIGHPPSNFVSANAPHHVAITAPFAAQGNRGVVFDHASHSFVSGPSASMARESGMRPMSPSASTFANRPMGPPRGARESIPSPRESSGANVGGMPAGGGMGGSPSVTGGASAGPTRSGGSAPAAAPARMGGAGGSPRR